MYFDLVQDLKKKTEPSWADFTKGKTIPMEMNAD